MISLRMERTRDERNPAALLVEAEASVEVLRREVRRLREENRRLKAIVAIELEATP